MNANQWTSLITFLGWWVLPIVLIFFVGNITFLRKAKRTAKKLPPRARRQTLFTGYRALRTACLPKPYKRTFGIAWLLLYTLVAISGWIYSRFVPDDRRVYDAVWGLFLANYVTNIAWIPLFFWLHKMILALLDLVLVLLTAVAILVLYIVDAAHFTNSSAWIALAFYIPYVFWTLYALGLSLDIGFTHNWKFPTDTKPPENP